ncbi:MAG: N-acyl homoserine lactonase family protein [Sphingobium sp.]|uniref:N-acyl homoserine lactonase family protein n=1 Tax=Sphingobium sp. TaxID=1912891 RepID=UPI002E1B8234
MALEIKVLDLGDIELESSFLVHARNCGSIAKVWTFGYLILGGEAPVLVDTGYRNLEIMARLGMVAVQTPEQVLEQQLAMHGLKYGDIKYVAHTHLHIDHAGKDDLFPDNTTVVVNRRELEYAVSGLMGAQYPPEDIKHLIDRLHTKDALRLLDLEITGGEELMPGVICVPAGAHTEGSMNILVETAEGIANICGDVIYDINDQVVEPLYQVNASEPATTGNHGCTKREEKGAIKKVLNSCRFVLPMHDRPAVVDGGQVIGRLHDQVPGPIIGALPKRQWFAV